MLSNLATLSVNSIVGTLANQTLCEGQNANFSTSNFTILGSKGCPPIISAAANNHIETITFLLSLGADINGINSDEETCLHVATRLSDPLPMVIFLLRKGADLESQNANEDTPLDVAQATNNTDLIKALGGE